MTILTERQWRKQSARKRQSVPAYWGAQYVLSYQKKKTIIHRRGFHAWMLIVSCAIALLMPLFFPSTSTLYYPEVVETFSTSTTSVRKVSAIAYQMPYNLSCSLRAFTTDELSRGHLLLIDDDHPLPSSASCPDTVSILHYSNGAVPVSDLTLQSGCITIDALKALFADLLTNGVSGLMVQTGAISNEQQQRYQLATLQSYALTMPLSEALALVWQYASYFSEFQYGYTVEIRLATSNYSPTSTQAVQLSKQSWYLLQNAWKHGFVLRYATDDVYCFRYVGKAHAMAMTYLNLSFEDYLIFLHENPVLTIYENGAPLYIIQSAPITDTHIGFYVADGATIEASLDNMGYAIVASTY